MTNSSVSHLWFTNTVWTSDPKCSHLKGALTCQMETQGSNVVFLLQFCWYFCSTVFRWNIYHIYCWWFKVKKNIWIKVLSYFPKLPLTFLPFSSTGILYSCRWTLSLARGSSALHPARGIINPPRPSWLFFLRFPSCVWAFWPTALLLTVEISPAVIYCLPPVLSVSLSKSFEKV